MENISVCTAVWRHDRREQKITSRQVITSRPSGQHVQPSAALDSALSQTKLAHILFNQVPQWRCIFAGVPVYTIMLIGRLSSDAFLGYIHRQVEQFSNDIAQKMLTHRSFQTIPDIAPRVVPNEDPRQRNYHNNAELRRNIGRDASRWVQLPAFSLFN